MRRRPRAVGAAVLALGILGGTVSGSALAPPDPVTTIDQAADVPVPAAYILDPVPMDIISVSQRSGLTAPTINATIGTANTLGVAAVNGRGFTLGMRQILRPGGAVVQQSQGNGWGFPMAVTALPIGAIGDIMGRTVAAPLSQGQIVLSQGAATLHHDTQVGDRIDLMNSSGGISTLTVGMIIPDNVAGGTEILMTDTTANGLGATTDTRMLMYGHFDRNFVPLAMAGNGLGTNTQVRVSRSWDPGAPDDTISLLRTKQLLGEFDIYYAGLANNSSGWVARDAGWSATHLPAAKDTYPGGIHALCHNAIKADLSAALQEVLNTYPSLFTSSTNNSHGIDVGNTNSQGGCATGGSARLSRIANGTGTVSRHSWGQAIDMSTTANWQGLAPPPMDCRIVRIFRKHGFAWGGNFLEPDGMHFEWVGEVRNFIQGGVAYCANTPTGQPQSAQPPPPKNRDTLFADDGWMGD